MSCKILNPKDKIEIMRTSSLSSKSFKIKRKKENSNNNKLQINPEIKKINK